MHIPIPFEWISIQIPIFNRVCGIQKERDTLQRSGQVTFQQLLVKNLESRLTMGMESNEENALPAL